MKNSQKAFTLIELLVVISIIGLLSSIVLASLQDARAKARDARRISDLRQIRTALEMYYNDHGYYATTTSSLASCNDYAYSYSSSWNTLGTKLKPYIETLPKDPINKASGPWVDGGYSYAYGNVCPIGENKRFDLMAQFENKENPLRCEIRQYKIATNGSTSWCGVYSKYLYDNGTE